MVDQFHLTIEVDNNDGHPYLLKESYIQRHVSLLNSYTACHNSIQQLSEGKVKDIADAICVSHCPLNPNSQKYYDDWKYIIFPQLQRDVARYFCAKSNGIEDLSKYISANEEVAAEMEVELEVDDMDLEMETSRTTTSNSNNVNKEEEVGGGAAATSTVHFKPIENAVNEQDADMHLAGSGDAEDDNLDFGGGGCDDSFNGDELDSTHLQDGIQQSKAWVALDAPEPDIEVLEESIAKEATRTKTKSPTSVNDTALFDSEVANCQEEEHQQEVEQQQQPKKKFQCPHCKKKYIYEKRYNNHIDVCKKKPSPPEHELALSDLEPIPSNVPAKVKSVEAAKERLDKLMKFNITLKRAVNEDEKKEICTARDYMHREIERAFGVLPDDYSENLTPWDENKKVVGDGLYDFDLGKKVGEGEDLNGRTNMQMPKYTTRSIISNPASEEVVQAILNLNLLMLKGHDPSKIDKTWRKIRRQVGEAIIHACYMVEGNVVLEFVLQMPTDRVREMVDRAPFLESLRKHPQYERLKILFGRCNSVMDADTWATILSVLHQNSAHIEHLLPKLDEFVTKW